MGLPRLTSDQIAETLLNAGYCLVSAKNYKNRKDTVTVKCKKCSGDLTSTLENLLRKSDRVCASCLEIARIENIENNLAKIKALHGLTTVDDFSRIKNMEKTKVNFTCKNGHHSSKFILGLLKPRVYGCQKCYTDSKRYSAEYIVAKTKLLRPDIEIMNPDEWVAISKPRGVECLVHNRVFKCSIHNIWNSKTTCPECRNFGFDVDSEGYLYYAKIKEFYKIGVTGWNPLKRLQGISEDAILIDSIKFDTGQKALDAETFILENFDYAKLDYNPGVKSGWSELFKFDIFSGAKLYAFRGL